MLTASTTSGTSAIVPMSFSCAAPMNAPRCPPASAPCATIASIPAASRARASATFVALPISFTPAAFAISALLLIFLLRRAFQTRKELANYQLGFHGERAVAEELNQLMLKGCRVFHDLPMDPYGNIDHIIVSSAGVFAVETKTRRKRPAPKGKRDWDAVFDGKAVNFPSWTETKMVNQALTQGERLSTLLTSAVGEPVAVQAVLTLPGWFVTSAVPPGRVRVVNPKGIESIAVDPPAARLTPAMIQRISHQLEQKCRTVDL